MADTYRTINTRFWSDNWIRKLNALDRYLFLYLLTNEHVSWCGIYELEIGMMAFECGIDKEDLQKTMLPRLEPKVIYSEGWVFIKNFSRYHTGGLNAEKGRKAAIEALPERIRAKVSLIEKKEAGKNNPLEGGAPFASASASTSTYIVASATEAFSFQKEIKKLEDSPHRYMNIIALYLENRKPDIRDSKQLSAAIKRHCKPAKILEVYADDQLIKAFKKSREVTPEWTLETVIKILTK